MRPKNKIIQILFALLLLTSNAWGSGDNWITRKVLTLADKDRRLWIHKNLPGIFPLTNLCKTMPEGSSKGSVAFPGDTVTFESKSGVIYCGNETTVWLGPNSTIRVLDTGPVPAFDSLIGDAYFRVGKSSFVLETNDILFKLKGERDLNIVRWNKSEKEEMLTCRSGEISTLASLKENHSSSELILSVFCKWNFRFENPEYEGVLWHAESFHIMDTFVSKLYRDLALQNKTALPVVPGPIIGNNKWSKSFHLDVKVENGNQIIIENSEVASQTPCELWASESVSFSDPKILKKFLMPQGKFQIVVDSPLKPQTNFALYCEKDGQYTVSNQYIPMEFGDKKK